MIRTVPNQRIIIFSSYDYTRFPVDAVRHLPSPALQLYMYIWSMRPACRNNVLLVSSAHIEKDIGISRNTYTKAFSILISQKFLIENNNKNNYIFYPARFSLSDDEELQCVKEYIYYIYGNKDRRCISEYQNKYYDGGYRYQNPPWKIAEAPECLDVKMDEDNDIQISNTEYYMGQWDEPQETPF